MPYDPSMQRRYRNNGNGRPSSGSSSGNQYRALSPALSSLPEQVLDRDARLERETRRVMTAVDRRQKVDQLNLAGVSNREIARQLKVDEKLVRNDMRIITQDRLWERGVTTLGERLDLSVRRRLQSYTSLMLIGASAEDEKAKVMAHAEANKILNDIDRLEGTAAPDSMNSAVLAEVMDVVMETLAEADPSVQRRVLEALAQRQPGGTQLGAMMGQTLPMGMAMEVEADADDVTPNPTGTATNGEEEHADDGNGGDDAGEADEEADNDDNSPEQPSRKVAYYVDPPANWAQLQSGYDTENGEAPADDDDPFADWPELPAE